MTSPETTSPSTPAGEPEPAAPIIERATQEGELVGWRVRLPNDTMLVFADQAAMPGFRIGTEFTPNYGKTIEYATPVPAQAVPAPVAVSEGLSDEQLDEIAAKVFDSEHDSGDCVQDDLSRALDRRFARKAIAADRSLRSDGQFGMDEDEWNKPTFDQARKSLGERRSEKEQLMGGVL